MGNAVPLRGQVSKTERLPQDVFAEVFADAVGAVERERIPYVLIGGLASASLGRPRWTHDIDVLVAPVDADRALDALGNAGFSTERTNPHWIYKAIKDEIYVDVMFRILGDVYLDDEMLERAESVEFMGAKPVVAAPEDQIVIKAIAHDEQSSRHWNDALSLIASCEIDWSYVIRRAAKGPRRVLSLLVYAQSNDLVVPSWVVRQLYTQIYEEDEPNGNGA